MLRRPRWLALAARPFGHALAGHALARRSPGRCPLAWRGMAWRGLAAAPWLLAAVPGLRAVRRRPAWALGAAVWPVVVHPVFPAGLRDAPFGWFMPSSPRPRQRPGPPDPASCKAAPLRQSKYSPPLSPT